MRNEKPIVELFTYTATDIDIFEITSKNIGKVGYITYQEKIGLWCFMPIENFFYKPIHLALILKKCNELNNYKKGE